MRALAILVLLSSPALAGSACDDMRKMERDLSSTKSDDLLEKYNVPQTSADRAAREEYKRSVAPTVAFLHDKLKSCPVEASK